MFCFILLHISVCKGFKNKSTKQDITSVKCIKCIHFSLVCFQHICLLSLKSLYFDIFPPFKLVFLLSFILSFQERKSAHNQMRHFYEQIFAKSSVSDCNSLFSTLTFSHWRMLVFVSTECSDVQSVFKQSCLFFRLNYNF